MELYPFRVSRLAYEAWHYCCEGTSTAGQQQHVAIERWFKGPRLKEYQGGEEDASTRWAGDNEAYFSMCISASSTFPCFSAVSAVRSQVTTPLMLRLRRTIAPRYVLSARLSGALKQVSAGKDSSQL